MKRKVSQQAWKQAANGFSPSWKFPGSHHSAFTLVELVVIVAVVFVLAGLLLPTLAGIDGSRESARRIACLNNNRQLGVAVQMYTRDNQDFLPWPNWGNAAAAPAGWLYKAPLPPTYSVAVYNLNPAGFEAARTRAISNGVLYQYVLNTTSFRCPLDPPGNTNSSWRNRANQLSSYLMNGAGAFFPSPANYGQYDYKTAKVSDIWNPECYLAWQVDPKVGFAWGDGASYPSNYESGLRVHSDGTVVLAIDGRAKWVSYEDFNKELNQPGKSLLWWNPRAQIGR